MYLLNAKNQKGKMVSSNIKPIIGHATIKVSYISK